MGRFVLAICLLVSSVASAGTLSTSPDPRAFGNVSVSAGAAASTVVITNAGSNTRVDAFTLGAGCAEFTATAAGLPMTLSDQETLTVNVTYNPADRVADTCVVTITDNNATTDSFTLTGDGIAPQLSVSPPSLAFADQHFATGTGQTLNITITNTGDEPIAASNLTAVLTTGTQFSLGTITGLPIAPGNSATLPVTFDPTSYGLKQDTVVIALDNDLPADGNKSVAVSGTGTSPGFAVSPASLDFMMVAVGSFAELTLTLTNQDSVSHSVDSIMSGNAAFTFAVVGPALPRTVTAGGTLQVTVRFTPTTGAVVMSSLIITTNGMPAMLTVPLTGDGVLSDVDVTMQNEADLMVALGTRRVGVAVTKLVTVTNTGETTVTLQGPTSNASQCLTQPVNPTSLPTAIAPAGTATFNVVVTPTAVGAGACTITITTSVPSTDTIAIDWTGIAPEVSLTLPANGAIDFGVVDVDAPVAVGSVVLANTGSDALLISACAITGSNRFSVQTACSIMIPPGNNATLMVQFDPSVEAMETSGLAITVDALSTNTVNIALTGIGSNQRIDLAATSITFPDTIVGTPTPPVQHIDVRNPLNTTTNVGETLHITMVTTDDAVFDLANEGPFEVTPDGMIRLAITFRPAADVVYDGTLVISSDGPMAEVALHGRGVAESGTETGGCCDSGSGSSTPLALCVLLLLVRRRRR